MEDSQRGTVPSTPGILFVGSKVVNPSNLNPLDFNDWYENTHIQEVQSTGGISGSQRYESLSFHKQYRDTSSKLDIANSNFDFDFVTVYNMPDLAFRESAAFRGLDGQSKPSEELLEGLFRQASFITRFAEEIGVEGESGGFRKGAAPFAVTVGIESGRSGDSGSGVMSALSKIQGYRRKRTLRVHENSLLDRFERSYMDEPAVLAILEFDTIPDDGTLEGSLEGAGQLEIGVWRLRRDYEGSERTPAGWKVPRR